VPRKGFDFSGSASIGLMAETQVNTLEHAIERLKRLKTEMDKYPHCDDPRIVSWGQNPWGPQDPKPNYLTQCNRRFIPRDWTRTIQGDARGDAP
jgi:hypothetical protein